MKQKESIIGWAFVLSLILVLLIIGDFLALHDINQDYVSSDVIDSIPAYDSIDLPEWAATKMEWIFVRISFILKLIITTIIAIALARTVIRLKL